MHRFALPLRSQPYLLPAYRSWAPELARPRWWHQEQFAARPTA